MYSWFKTKTKKLQNFEEGELYDIENDSKTTLSRNSLHVDGHNVLDTSFFQHRDEYQPKDLKYDLLSNVCICIIDIVGFSSWCSDHLPNIIAKAMLEYNDWIGLHISNYPCVNKIELVGDSCMLISGRVGTNDAANEETIVYSYLSMIRMAVDLLEDLFHFRNIFRSSSIGLRIGIHVSDVIGVYLQNPCKYQMFGNDINVCSRLESSCIPNTVHVSEKTLMCIQNACISTCGPCSRCVKGHVIRQNYKGVGYKSSYQLFLKKKDIYLVNMKSLFTKEIEISSNGQQFRTSDVLEVCISDCGSFFYRGLVINISKERSLWDDIQTLIDEIKTNPHFTQQVCLITTNASLEDVKRLHKYDFDHILSFETDDFIKRLNVIFEAWSQKEIQSHRGSLDLTVD